MSKRKAAAPAVTALAGTDSIVARIPIGVGFVGVPSATFVVTPARGQRGLHRQGRDGDRPPASGEGKAGGPGAAAEPRDE